MSNAVLIRNISNKHLPVMTNGVPRFVEAGGSLNVSREDADKILEAYPHKFEVENIPVAMMPPTGRL